MMWKKPTLSCVQSVAFIENVSDDVFKKIKMEQKRGLWS